MTAHRAPAPHAAHARGVFLADVDAVRQALRTAVVGGVALLAACGALLVLRRWAGAATRPPEPLLLVALGAIFVLAGWSLRWMAYRAAPRQGPLGFAPAISIATSTAVCGLACGLTFAATPLGVRAVFWLIVLGSELAAWRAYRGAAPFKPGGEGSHRETATAGVGARLPQRRAPRPPADATVLQQQVRIRSAAGCETLTGDFRAAFLPAQRSTSLHVAFCPPFVLAPDVHVQQISGPEARLKIAQVLPFGARIDVKLSREATTSTEVVVHVAAQCEATPAADRIAS